MRKIAVFTGTRAEYGLLYWLMKTIQHDDDLHLQLIVSGAHLSPQYGDTWKEIEADGFKIDSKVEMLLSSDSPSGIVKSMGLALIGFADSLTQLNPDLLVVLGDRVEALAIAQAALILKIPLAHLHGGELTLGAYDDAARHAITKMSSLHFVATETYRRRVIQMGEDPAKVFNVGAVGLEHVIKTEKYSFNDLVHHLQIPLQQPYFLIGYHPVTLAQESTSATCHALFKLLDEHPDFNVLFTYPNADNGGYEIIQLIENYCKGSTRAFVCKSLGYKKYLSAVAHAEVVIGNSSSGIIEVPSLGIPTINIGLRQQGRLAAKSVIQTAENYDALNEALGKALSSSFKKECQHTINPYGNGRVSERILPILKQQTFSATKHFQDMDVQYEKI